MRRVNPLSVPSTVLSNALAELHDGFTKTEKEQMRQLYMAPKGFEFSVDTNNRPQGPTIYACRIIGTKIKRKLGYGPVYGMSFIGHSEGWRWVMNHNVREAISTLGWFGSPTQRRRGPKRRHQDVVPSDPNAEFDLAVRTLLRRKELSRPTGTKNPERLTVMTIRVRRDPHVVAWVLQQAKGKCDCCKKKAPFEDVNNFQFLEVHHIWRLADGGPDTPENAVAICPNCHRELHYGRRALELVEDMYSRIKRLKNGTE